MGSALTIAPRIPFPTPRYVRASSIVTTSFKPRYHLQGKQGLLSASVAEMEFPKDLLELQADKPIRICVSAPIATLNQIYSVKFPTAPLNGNELNPAGVEFVRDVYSHIFHLDEAANMIKSYNHVSRDKHSEKTPLPCKDEDIAWHTWFAVFDHLVPPEDNDPETLQLYMLDDAKFVRGRSRSDRPRINSYVQHDKDHNLKLSSHSVSFIEK